MTNRLAEIEARIDTVRKLSAVIAAMRGIAASREQEARRHLDSIRVFTATIGDAIGHALALLPDADGARRADAAPGRLALVVLAAEQGFAGAYNDNVFDRAETLIRSEPKTAVDLLVAGDRGLLVADERGLSVDWSAPMIAHPAQVAGLATRITEAIYRRLADAQIARVSLVHATPGGAQGAAVLARPLVPFDFSRFPAPRAGIAPLVTLPPDRLLARLVEEYVFSEISEAIMLAFAAENEARMRAMMAAHENVASSLDALSSTSRQLRQEEITDEIVELASGSLPVR